MCINFNDHFMAFNLQDLPLPVLFERAQRALDNLSEHAESSQQDLHGIKVPTAQLLLSRTESDLEYEERIRFTPGKRKDLHLT